MLSTMISLALLSTTVLARPFESCVDGCLENVKGLPLLSKTSSSNEFDRSCDALDKYEFCADNCGNRDQKGEWDYRNDERFDLVKNFRDNCGPDSDSPRDAGCVLECLRLTKGQLLLSRESSVFAREKSCGALRDYEDCLDGCTEGEGVIFDDPQFNVVLNFRENCASPSSDDPNKGPDGCLVKCMSLVDNRPLLSQSSPDGDLKHSCRALVNYETCAGNCPSSDSEALHGGNPSLDMINNFRDNCGRAALKGNLRTCHDDCLNLVKGYPLLSKTSNDSERHQSCGALRSYSQCSESCADDEWEQKGDPRLEMVKNFRANCAE